MKITIKNSIIQDFPCLMKNNLGQILLVIKTHGFLDPIHFYTRTIIANLDNSFVNVGSSVSKEGVDDLHFLPKGYKVTIEN